MNWLNLLKKSPHCDATFQKLKEKTSNDSPGIRALCPTRWTARAQVLHSILARYKVLQILWDEYQKLWRTLKWEAEFRGYQVVWSHLIFTLEYHWESYCLTTVITLAKHFNQPVCQQQKGRKQQIWLFVCWIPYTQMSCFALLEINQIEGKWP